MNFVQFITTKSFLKHLGISILLSLILIWLVLLSLRFYTHHSTSIATPPLTNLTLEQAKKLESVQGLELYVIDSVYDISKKPGTITTQDPAAGAKVKPGRKIYISVVSMLPEQVKMPVLVDLSLRQAKALLQTYGLVLGSVITIPNMPLSAVIKAKMNGGEIPEGALIRKGSVIDLFVGQGMSVKQAELPFLIGKPRQEAVALLKSLGFTIGGETYSPACDSISGIVFEQTPIYVYGKNIPTSNKLFLSYKSAKEFDFDTYIKNMVIDTFQKNANLPSIMPDAAPNRNTNPIKPMPNPAQPKAKPKPNTDERF